MSLVLEGSGSLANESTILFRNRSKFNKSIWGAETTIFKPFLQNIGITQHVRKSYLRRAAEKEEKKKKKIMVKLRSKCD